MLNAKGPGSCHYFIADLTVRKLVTEPLALRAHRRDIRWQTKAGCDKLAASIKERESKVHILVNNSGMSWGAPYDE